MGTAGMFYIIQMGPRSFTMVREMKIRGLGHKYIFLILMAMNKISNYRRDPLKGISSL